MPLKRRWSHRLPHNGRTNDSSYCFPHSYIEFCLCICVWEKECRFARVFSLSTSQSFLTLEPWKMSLLYVLLWKQCIVSSRDGVRITFRWGCGESSPIILPQFMLEYGNYVFMFSDGEELGVGKWNSQWGFRKAWKGVQASNSAHDWLCEEWKPPVPVRVRDHVTPLEWGWSS